MSRILLHELHGGAVARLVLNAPKGNVLDGAMIAEITWAARELASRQRLRAVVLEGEGLHFSYGTAVQEHYGERAAEMLAGFHGMLYALLELGTPLVAKVRGYCLGGGLELAALCHFLICDRTARFGQPEAKLGVFAPAASLLLPMRVGQTKADELLLTGATLDADEALACGLVTTLADWDGLDTAVERFLEQRLLPLSASSLRHAARAARWSFEQTMRAELPRLEKRYLEQLMATHDATEGLNAFLEKREPRWSHD